MEQTEPLVQPMTALLPSEDVEQPRRTAFARLERLEAWEITLGGPLVAPSGSASRKASAPIPFGSRKTPPERGFLRKRLKGLEPSTFCMASRRSSQLSYSREVAEYNPAIVGRPAHGTLIRALALGRSVVAVPHAGETPENVARLAWSCAGVRTAGHLRPDRPCRSVAAAVRADAAPPFAGALAAWTQLHDGPGRAADL